MDIFEKIYSGEIPSRKIYDDGEFFAILDINPLTEGHTLVVPKKEIDYIFDLDDETLQGMIVFAKRVAKKIQAKIACKRVAVVVFGLEVPHAHIHLIPMENEYDVDFRKVKPKFTPEEFEETARMIRE